jgi:TRAP-type transport system small permease protein
VRVNESTGSSECLVSVLLKGGVVLAQQSLPRRLISYFDRIVGFFIFFNILALAVLVFTQVLMRYVFRSPLMGIEELCHFPATWLYLFAAVKASSERSQLYARVIEILIKNKRKVYLLRCLAAVVTTGILMWLTYWGYDLLKYSMRVDKLTDTLFIHWVLAEGAVFVSFALMLFSTIVEILDYFLLYRGEDLPLAKAIEEEL